MSRAETLCMRLKKGTARCEGDSAPGSFTNSISRSNERISKEIFLIKRLSNLSFFRKDIRIINESQFFLMLVKTSGTLTLYKWIAYKLILEYKSRI